jgi:hypothetical protein
MRRSLLSNFHRIWIDNLNGDKFKSGKIIPTGLPREETVDQSAFTTDADPQPGTAVVTWLKLPALQTTPNQTRVAYLDFSGLANWKRTSLLASLPSGTPRDASVFPVYRLITPTPENCWRLSPHIQEPDYEIWPGLDELFPIAFQGVNHSRGLDNSVIDYHRQSLTSRPRGYIEADSFNEAAQQAPAIAGKLCRIQTRKSLEGTASEGVFEPDGSAIPNVFLASGGSTTSRKGNCSTEVGPKGVNLAENKFLITVPKPRKVSESRPLYAMILVNLHVHGGVRL